MRRLHSREARIQALMPVNKALMIDAEAVKQRRLKIADMDRVANDVVRKLVRFAVHDSALEAAPGNPG